ncbi:MAG: bifunctional UDP-N-acetylglucosamine diphosphorylase/glucosamine-1-phosphate N-acetyltransferase GlmU [Bacillota bacterium]|nr:bifunctional UDP-N-acetylglucosamine diphosphorylase/glucosamine-1-phosphate N-acetyltransferase GlmU [Bacillota bacterium]
MCYNFGMNDLKVVILAAGLGKRMYSELPKALHKVCGKSMLAHVCDAASGLSDGFVCVVGHGKEQVMCEFEGKMHFVFQEKQLGTGHAVKMAEHDFGEGDVLVLFADTPLITKDTLKSLVEEHRQSQNAATLITADFNDPASFGRIVREDGRIQRIVEFKNATDEEKKIKEINSGMAVFNAALLREKLAYLSSDNAQGEYLLTDVFEMLIADGHKVGAIKTENTDEILGVNDRYMLSEAERILQQRIRKEWMLAGVTMHFPETIMIEKDVQIEPGAVIEQGTRLMGKTSVASGAVIGPFTDLTDVRVGAGSTLDRTVAVESEIGKDCKIGPFAYIRPGSVISNKVKIGDFVELKNVKIGEGTKIPHLSYIGDGEIGERTNIGCGTIFVNYDGEHKHRTVVGSDAFIGCNSNLVAPVTIGDGTFVAAGTTVTREVKEGEFAISRVPQENRENRRKPKK